MGRIWQKCQVRREEKLNENQEQVTREKALIGAAGVHFVCGELSRRGFIALPTIRNTRGIDILAITPKGKQIAIQVKTMRNRNRWPVPKEDKIQENEDYFFVFVNLKGSLEKRPDCYMVSSKFLKDYTAKAFKAWLKTPGKRGKPHSKENPFRYFPVPERRFKEKSYQEILGKPIDLEDFKMDRVLRKILEE
jgi:hypothetical protein